MGDVLDVLSAGRCFVCEATDRLTVDHVVCMTNGGENTRPNLQCLCLNCNSQKHRSSMEEFLAKKRAA